MPEMLRHFLEKEPVHSSNELLLRTAAVMNEHESRHVNDEVEGAIYHLTEAELVAFLKPRAGMENYGLEAQDYLTKRLDFWKSLVPLLRTTTLKLTAKEIAKELQELAAHQSIAIEHTTEPKEQSTSTQHQQSPAPKEMVSSSTPSPDPSKPSDVERN